MHSHICNTCFKSFGTIQQCNLHKFKAHGWLHPAHYLVDDVYCPCCLKYLHTRSRVLEHLRYKSPTCFHNLTLRGNLISHDVALDFCTATAPVETLNRRAGRRRAHAAKPVCRAQRPLLPILPLC